MSRGYTVEFEGATVYNVDGTYDHFTLFPADDRPINTTVVVLDVLSELGDAQEEHIRLRLIRGHTSGGGTATASVPHDPNDAAAGAVNVYTNNTGSGGGGTPVTLWSDGFNVRIGFRRGMTEEMTPKTTQTSAALILRQMDAVTDDVEMSGTLGYVEATG